MVNFTDGITRFLPKYPNVVPYDDDLLNPYEGKFYDSIYRKKEFYDLRLSKIESVPEKPGDLMNHQKIIARYLSSHTPYNGVLLFHEMGTGKTCSAVGAIEQIKSERKFKGAIYIASITLSKNFLNELVNVCTDGRYIPEDLGDTARTEKNRMKKAVSEYYKLGSDYTYAKFSKRVKELSKDEILKRYNNHIIVIDEVHNLADNNKEGASYKQIWKFLHVVQGCKVILLSGTPMRNRVWDIASVMNLILPENKQLPTGKKFVDEYCDKVDKDLDLITDKGSEVLMEC
jgi:SNF2 family DNA or RNA helicase